MSPYRCPPRRPRATFAHRSVRHLTRSALTALAALVLALGSFSPLGILGQAPAAYAQATGTVTVRVFRDADRDGVYDTGEPLLPNIPVTLYSVDDEISFSNSTSSLAGSLGEARFTGVTFDDYRAEVTLPANHVVSVPGASFQNSGLLFRVPVSAGSPTPSFDVGLRQLSGGQDPGITGRSLDVRVWDDGDSDGIQDADELGLTGLTVVLTNTSGFSVTAVADAAASGRYRFDAAPTAAGYFVSVLNPPTGYTLTRPFADPRGGGANRDSDAALVTGLVDVPLGTNGFNLDSLDIGYTKAAVSGYIFRDVDANGVNDGGPEERLDGIVVELLNASGTPIKTTTTSTAIGIGGLPTGLAGVYQFTGIDPGSYFVRVPESEFDTGKALFGAANSPTFDGPPPSDDRAGPDGLVATGGVSIPVTLDYSNVLTGSNRVANAVFGFYKGSVGDFVWYDLNRDGQQTGEETLGQSGIRVFVDADGDGLRDTDELSTTTGANGFYLFSDLALNQTYTITLDVENFQPGQILEGIAVHPTNALSATLGGVTYYYTTTGLLTAGAPSQDGVDFGLTRSDIGNVVFEDENGNGIYDPVESGIPDVTVELRRASNNSVVITGTTSITGAYTLPNLPALGYYAVFDLTSTGTPTSTFVASPQITTTVDPQELTLFDYTDVLTDAVSTGRWRTPIFTPTAGVENKGVDAGFYGLATLAGRAFFDTDADDSDNAPIPEPGMRGITVTLRSALDPTVAVSTTTTLNDATGAYTFANVRPGGYVVEFANPVPAVYEVITGTTAPTTTGDILLSDVETLSGSDGRTGTVGLFSGGTTDEVDAGFRGRGTAGGLVFTDENGNDLQDGADTSLPAATVGLTVTANLPNLVAEYFAGEQTSTSAATQNYTFTLLPFGTGVTYTLGFTAPVGAPPYFPSVANVGTDDQVDSDGPAVTIPNPTADADADQGYYQQGQITVRVFEEIENDPARIDNKFDDTTPVADEGIQGVTVTLERAGGGSTPGVSDSQGLITYTVKPGAYLLDIDQDDAQLDGFLPSEPNFTDPVSITGDLLTSGGTSSTDTDGANSFGYYQPATITGTVFFDRDQDTLKLDEPGVQGVRVELTGPSGTLTTTTNASGVYSFTDLLPGDATSLYTLTFTNPDATNFAFFGGGDSDVDTSGVATTTLAYATGASVDAGLVGLATVGGTTFEDGEADGLSGGANDAALPGVTVTLRLNVNIPGTLTTQIVTTTTTAAGGGYSFGGLPGAVTTTNQVAYTLTFTAPDTTYNLTTADVGDSDPTADTATNDSDGELANQPLGKGASDERDQGYYQNVTVTAVVFEEDTAPVDNDFDAANDNPVEGVRVDLETLTGTLVVSATTDASGVASFSARPGVAYRLNVDQDAAALAGLVPSPNHTDPVTVTTTPAGGVLYSGQSSLADATPRANSFGFYEPATVTGVVFFDRDQDTLKTGEPGVQGVEVALTGGATPLTTTTNAAGVYTFTNLVAASYTLTFTNPDTANFAFFNGGDSDVTTGGVVTPVNLAYGASASYDAGLVGLATVGGTTFEDGEADGLSGGANDAALPGVTVTLRLNVNIPGTLTTQIVTTTTTAAGGGYSFGGLPGAVTTTNQVAYTLTFTAPDTTYNLTTPDVGDSDPTADTATNDSDGELVNQPLGKGASDERDQGYYQNVTVSARVFDERVDVADNQYRAGDLGLPNVTVNLEPESETPIPGETGAGGLVTFTVKPGIYQLNIDESDPQLAGLSPSEPNFTDPISLGLLLSGATSLTDGAGANSFGYFRNSTITGRVFFDSDPGVAAASEPGLEGVEVALLQGSTPVGTTTTTATGAYTFTGVVSNTYTLVFTNPANLAFDFFSGSGSALTAIASDDVTATIDLGLVPFSTDLTGQDAGLKGVAAVGGYTFVDGDADGLSSGAADGPLGGVTVTLRLDVDLPGLLTTQITRTATTPAGTGVYSFTGLAGGGTSAYTLTFTAPDATWVLTEPDVNGNANNTTDSDGSAELLNQPFAGGEQAARDQGYYRNATIAVRVFDERVVANNSFETGEQGIPSVTVGISPADADGQTDDTTDDSGVVTFTVKPGPYTITAPPLASLPAGFEPSPGNLETSTVTMTTGLSTTVPFGYYQPSTLGGTAWFDSSRDGLLDLSEPIVEPITVTLRSGDDQSQLDEQTTDATGAYTFTGVLPTGTTDAPASYQICFASTADLTYTTRVGTLGDDNNSDAGVDGCTGTFTLPGSNTVSTTLDVGYVGVYSIGDLVWEDADGDGLQDPSESGVAGAVVTVAISTTDSLNATGPTVIMTSTLSTATANLAPNYSIPGVPRASGYRVVSVSPPPGYVPTPANQGTDEALDGDAVGESFGAVPPDAVDTDFGLTGVTTVGDFVWLDLNGNGRYDAASEAGAPGVRVELLSGSTVISATVTGIGAQAGQYSFDDINPGVYTLRFEAPFGYEFTNDGLGNIATDGDNDAGADGFTVPFTVTGGQQIFSVDAGLRGNSGISGIVWVDTNRNSIRETQEISRVAGVQVTLTVTPTLTPSRTNVVTTTTGSNGAYSFAYVPEGQATVRFIQPAGYFPVSPNIGPDTTDSDGPVVTLSPLPGQQIANVDMGYRVQGVFTYLPQVFGRPQLADLSATFTVTPASPQGYAPAAVAVTVTNTGDGPASNFWVDLYINPTRRPVVNDRWNDIPCDAAVDPPCQGIAWFYTGTLAPGQSVTLVSTATSDTSAQGYVAGASIWSGTFFNGTSKLYVLVDSWNRSEDGSIRDPNGAVQERNEGNNLSERTITVTPGTPPEPEFAPQHRPILDRSVLQQ